MPLQVCVQVNISGEVSKSGCAPADAAALCDAIAAQPGLNLRGLMTIPAPGPDHEVRAAFRTLRELYQSLPHQGHELDTLSIDTSDDPQHAIAKGSITVATRVQLLC